MYCKNQHCCVVLKLSVTKTPGKLGRAVSFRLYFNWFVSDFTLWSVSIYLFYSDFKKLFY